MHPVDYALVQQAANHQKQGLADFIALAAYLYAREVLAQIDTRTAAAPDFDQSTDALMPEHADITKF